MTRIAHMKLSIYKAIKSTHRHPISRGLHLAGLCLYAAGLTQIAGFFLGGYSQDRSLLVSGIMLFPIAISLFLAGHKIEGNLRAMTLVIIAKYLSSKVALK
jgi:hypothetical protein